MKKLIVCALAAVVLMGCDQARNDVRTAEYDTSSGILKGCQVGKAYSNSSSPNLYVVRCPNETVSTRWKSGKTYKDSVTISE